MKREYVNFSMALEDMLYGILKINLLIDAREIPISFDENLSRGMSLMADTRQQLASGKRECFKLELLAATHQGIILELNSMDGELLKLVIRQSIDYCVKEEFIVKVEAVIHAIDKLTKEVLLAQNANGEISVLEDFKSGETIDFDDVVDSLTRKLQAKDLLDDTEIAEDRLAMLIKQAEEREECVFPLQPKKYIREIGLNIQKMN